MTVQMTVRLPDDVAAVIDRQVRDGAAPSRAAAIAAMVRAEQVRLTAQRDADIYAAAGDDDDMNALASWSLQHSQDID